MLCSVDLVRLKRMNFWQFPFFLLEFPIDFLSKDRGMWLASERRVKWLSCSHTLFLRPQQQAFLTAFRGEYQKVLHLSLLELLKDEKAFESHKIKLFKPFSSKNMVIFEFSRQNEGENWQNFLHPFFGYFNYANLICTLGWRKSA